MTETIPKLGALIGFLWLAAFLLVTGPARALGLMSRDPAWVDVADARLRSAA